MDADAGSGHGDMKGSSSKNSGLMYVFLTCKRKE